MPSLSVIIIARDEQNHLPRLLERLRAMPQITQVILSDGGSTDETASLAQKAGATVVFARGRGAQLNAGAHEATGEILWFLHADCLPSRGCGGQITASYQRGFVGGHFRMRFQSRSLWARGFEFIARIQARLGWFYGDSGIWATRAVYDTLGGFAPWALFEDLDFARRLETQGRLQTLPGRLAVSARRFHKRPARALWLWLELQGRFWLGQAPDELARLYRERL